MIVEGSVRISWLNRTASNERPIFSIAWRPCPTRAQSKTVPAVRRTGIIALHNFLRDQVGIPEAKIEAWLQQLVAEGEVLIHDVIFDSGALSSIGFAA
jgi:hypothetical protein